MASFITTLLTTSLSMSVVALLYIALHPVLIKQYTAKSIYYGWLIILLGLIIPFRPHFSKALIQIDPAFVDFISTPNVNAQMDYTTNSVMNHTSIINHSFEIQWPQIIFFVCLAGFVLMMVYHIWKHTLFMKSINRWSEDILSTQIGCLTESLKEEMKISRKIHIKNCPCISTPMLVGFFKPTVLLPSVDWSSIETSLILRHELIHYKHKDLLYKVFMLIVIGVHWFNPIVYIIANYASRICEISCDEKVAHYLNRDSRKLYAEIIINACRQPKKFQTVLSTNFIGGKKTMKNRILSIMNTKEKRFGLLILCLIFVATITTGEVFATDKTDLKSDSKAIESRMTEQANVSMEQKDNDTVKHKIAIYENYGLTYDEEQDMFFYNGKTVKYFYDQLNASNSYYFIMRPKGEISLKALRNEVNELTGITVISNHEEDNLSQQFFSESNSSQTAIHEEKSVSHNTEKAPFESRTDKIAKDCYPYKAYGLAYDPSSDMLYYQGEAVYSFFDEIDTNRYFFITRPTGSIFIKALRNEDGQLVGIDYASAEEYEQLFGPVNQ
ncbi:M56 family metallopeptidase [Vallitalea okinawensis]|uniref:M56 family metallopeptidase n=1 Tax=Vallitalea okinawensis TaxID=2078660 RepID=UPI0013003200|nr:M56 family metallopeptidase [Vallitalea okinawensis]